MSRFLRRLLAYGGVICVLQGLLSAAIYAAIGPDSLPVNPLLALKRNYLEAHPNVYNVVFFGSSQTYRQIDIPRFDSVTGCRAFNAGVNGFNPPFTTAFALREVTSGRLSPHTLVVLELSRIQQIGENCWSPDVYYALPYREALSSLWQRQDSGRAFKLFESLNIACAFMNKALTPLGAMTHGEPRIDPGGDTLGTDGYYPLELQLEVAVRCDNRSIVDGLRRRQSDLASRGIYRYRVNGPDSFSGRFDLSALETACQEHGYRLAYLIPPRVGHDSVRQIFGHVREDSVLDFSDAATYPRLYENQYSFDPEHLNTVGAQIYTELVAESLRLHHLLP